MAIDNYNTILNNHQILPLKNLLAAFLLLMLSTASIAQNSPDFFRYMPIIDDSTPEWAKKMYSENPSVVEVENLYRAYYAENDFVKNIHTQNHKHWIFKIEQLVNEEGYIQQPTQAEEEAYFLEIEEEYAQQSQMGIQGSQFGWVAMGPFETYKQNTSQPVSWHKNIYAIDQSLTNTNILICGTEAGGVYKSSNKGQDWTLISSDQVFSGGNAAVKIHPTDTNNFLLASNNRIYQSLDGGNTWIAQHVTGGTGNEFQYDPDDADIIFHTNSQGLFKSIDGGDTWSQVFTDGCWDIDFHPTDSEVAYLLKSNAPAKRSELFRSDDGGNTWALKDTNWYVPAVLAQASDAGGKIAVTAAAPDIVYVCLIGASKSNDDGWIGIYKSSDRGDNWTDQDGQDGNPYGAINGTSPWNVAAYGSGYHQGYYNFDMEASPFDSNRIWVATIRLSESEDGGATFTSIGAANSQQLSDFHADVQDIEVYGEDIWVASDGGINYSSDTLLNHVALNRGIHAAHFWGFNTGWNEDTYTGGKYHDGTTGWTENYGLHRAYNIGGVEEASGYVHPIEDRKLLYRIHYASENTAVKTIPLSFGDPVESHPNLPVRPNEGYWTAERSGVFFNPWYADHMYVGLGNSVFKSTDGGSTFDTLYTFPFNNALVYEIDIARSNPKVMYVVLNKLGGYWNPCELWKTTNGGATWSKTSSDPSGNNRRFRISVHPENANTVWLCTPRGTNGNKVFVTTNGGNSWTNRTTSVLNDENLTDILYQGGTNDVVYVTSQNGVYYWDASTSNWIAYNTGLPVVAKTLQLNPFYRDAELRLASAGRGVWARKMQDTLSLPIAQPITYTDSVHCLRDTTQFECYSMLRHDGATWDWEIAPTPLFISDTSTRNPTVLFGDTGNFTVTLAITDAQGNTDTTTIENMVYVSNGCSPDTVPGLTMECLTNQSYATTPDLDLPATTQFTISAWIKPNGTQNAYTGIVMNDGTAGGINFRNSNELGYHWPGGQWWWNSGLVVESGKWSHVAMVVQPGSVTIYLNGVASVHNVGVQAIDIQNMRIGSYQGWTSRNFNGQIDEVCIWSDALSQNQIRRLRHLTRTGPTPYDDDLEVYYQFNLKGNTRVMDKIGIRHASLYGTASKVLSTAPIGGGTSHKINIANNSAQTFGSTQTRIDFSTSNAAGEVVVSRLHIAPDSLPNSNPHAGNYWIVNNYGTNTTFAALQSIKFKSTMGVPFGLPADAKLFKRDENEHLENWVQLCGAQSFNSNYYSYGSNCSVTNMTQFFIQSANTNAVVGNYVIDSIDAQICSYDSIYVGGAYQQNAGVYFDTTNIASGLDSVAITTLTVDSIVGTDVQTACDSYTWVDGQTYTSSNNTATVLTNIGGTCDSVSILDLTLNFSSDYTDVINTCDQITWLDGNTYTSSNTTATHIVTNAAGCDSVITLNLNLPSIDNTVSTNGSTLTSNQNGAAYQWLDCNENFLILTGETAQSFTALSSGIYAVKIDLDNCADTSVCTDVVGLGTSSIVNSDVSVYPNPTTGLISIELGIPESVNITVHNSLGQLIQRHSNISDTKVELTVNGSPGVYVISIESNNTHGTYQIIKY